MNMLLFDSTRPDLDLLGSADPSPHDLAVAELLCLITENHYSHTAACFQQLEKRGAFLGNGGFLVVTAFWAEDHVLLPETKACLRPLIAACKAAVQAPLFYSYTCAGHLYFLLCYPRATGDGSMEHPVVQQAMDWFTQIQTDVAQEYPGLHFLLSDFCSGEHSIYLIANSLYHAKEYYLFRTQTPSVIQVDLESHLHSAFIQDFGAYRQLAIQIADQIVQDTCDTSSLSRMVTDELLRHCAPSSESLHHHIQIFVLTLTDYLGSTGIVDSAYLARHRIEYRIMCFETEREFRANLFQLFEELRKRFLTLRTAGKQHRIVSIREYVDAHAACSALSVTQIADHFALNPSLLTKQFQHYFGVTLHRYIQQQRLQLAQHIMMERPKASLSEIAQAAGYTDLSTMYRAFRKLEGTTPGVCRNSLRCHREQQS